MFYCSFLSIYLPIHSIFIFLLSYFGGIIHHYIYDVQPLQSVSFSVESGLVFHVGGTKELFF
jgi:hypothetical protein